MKVKWFNFVLNAVFFITWNVEELPSSLSLLIYDSWTYITYYRVLNKQTLIVFANLFEIGVLLFWELPISGWRVKNTTLSDSLINAITLFLLLFQVLARELTIVSTHSPCSVSMLLQSTHVLLKLSFFRLSFHSIACWKVWCSLCPELVWLLNETVGYLPIIISAMISGEWTFQHEAVNA